VLDDLLASGPWRHEPHSLTVRQEVFKAKRRRQLEFGAGDNPIEAFLALRRKDAGKRRRSASDIAQVQRERKAAAAKAKAGATAPSPLAPAPAPPEPVSSQLVTGPVKGKQLRIERGYAR
jgi:hypothetical protein